MVDDWLTWQALRALATHEVQKDGHEGVRYVEPRQPEHYRVALGRLMNTRADKPLTPGALVYARDAWRHPWRNALRRVPVPCVLLTVFSDRHVKAHATEGLLEGTAIRHWFAVQCETRHPKLTAMPIGIDGRKLPTLERAVSRPIGDRDVRLYANFQARNAEREALLEHCLTQPWIETQPWNRTNEEYFAWLGRSVFVLSPPGQGWDCYRTYEAIAMGAIPIVRRQVPLSNVVNGLPVVLVDDWREVTPERLAFEYQRLRGTWNLERMTVPYWADRIQAA